MDYPSALTVHAQPATKYPGRQCNAVQNVTCADPVLTLDERSLVRSRINLIWVKCPR